MYKPFLEICIHNEVYMEPKYIRSDSCGIRKYYESINHNNLQIRKYLGLTKYLLD